MAAKSFVPQLVRQLRRIARYIIKHQATINQYLTTQQQTDLATIVNLLIDFAAVVIVEQP